jgi:hypothetical protein
MLTLALSRNEITCGITVNYDLYCWYVLRLLSFYCFFRVCLTVVCLAGFVLCPSSLSDICLAAGAMIDSACLGMESPKITLPCPRFPVEDSNLRTSLSGRCTSAASSTQQTEWYVGAMEAREL